MKMGPVALPNDIGSSGMLAAGWDPSGILTLSKTTQAELDWY
jgi:hypothetical protein